MELVLRGSAGSLSIHTSCEEDARKLGNEERETDADRRKEGSLVLFRCQHEDGEDEFGGQEHLDDCAKSA